jgi:hypothetical protein
VEQDMLCYYDYYDHYSKFVELVVDDNNVFEISTSNSNESMGNQSFVVTAASATASASSTTVSAISTTLYG